MTAMGAPDNAWGLRDEHLLAGAVLRVNLAAITSPPLNLQTNDSDPTASGYNPFAPGAPVTIYASGVRNAYDLVWHSNGQLYVPDQRVGRQWQHARHPLDPALGLHPSPWTTR